MIEQINATEEESFEHYIESYKSEGFICERCGAFILPSDITKDFANSHIKVCAKTLKNIWGVTISPGTYRLSMLLDDLKLQDVNNNGRESSREMEKKEPLYLPKERRKDTILATLKEMGGNANTLELYSRYNEKYGLTRTRFNECIQLLIIERKINRTIIPRSPLPGILSMVKLL